MRESVYTDAQWEFLFQLHLRGYSMKELSEWAFVSPKTLSYNFRRMGLTHSRDTCGDLDYYADMFHALGGN